MSGRIQRSAALQIGLQLMNMADMDKEQVYEPLEVWVDAYRDITWAARENYQRHANTKRLKEYKEKLKENT